MGFRFRNSIIARKNGIEVFSFLIIKSKNMYYEMRKKTIEVFLAVYKLFTGSFL